MDKLAFQCYIINGFVCDVKMKKKSHILCNLGDCFTLELLHLLESGSCQEFLYLILPPGDLHSMCRGI